MLSIEQNPNSNLFFINTGSAIRITCPNNIFNVSCRLNTCLLFQISNAQFLIHCKPLCSFQILAISESLIEFSQASFPELLLTKETQVKYITRSFNRKHGIPYDSLFEKRVNQLIQIKSLEGKQNQLLEAKYFFNLLSAYKGLINGNNQSERERKFLQDIKDYIDEKLGHSSKVEVKSIAERFSMNEKKMAKLFMQLEGLPTNQYLAKAKTQAIQRALENPLLSVLHIALSFGFSDENSLRKFFKRNTGSTPYQYRKQRNIPQATKHKK